MSKYQLEPLLRPPVELWSAFVALIVALVAAIAPHLWFMPPSVAYAASAFLVFCVALPRAMQARRVIKYQRNMRRLPSYKVKASKIPTRKDKLFLGKGFAWTQKHTQRLRDSLNPNSRKYLEPSGVQKAARAIERVTGKLWILQKLVPSPPPVGGNKILHAVEPDEKDVFMDLGDRVGHTLVLGTTRVGKTRMLEVLCTQDIHRGEVVIVFDPKGDADLLKRMYAEAKRSGRDDAFYIFHLGHPEISARYNAIGSFSRISEVATRIANQLPSEGNSAAFKEFGWRFINIVARALVALGRRPDYRQIRQHINDIEQLFIEYAEHVLPTMREHWRADIAVFEKALEGKPNSIPRNMVGRQIRAIAIFEFIREARLHEPVLDGLVSAFQYDKTYFDKIVSSVGPLMEKLTTGKVAELLSPDYLDEDDPRPIFDWRQVIRQRAIVYIGLDALGDMTVASAVGNSMFADLVSVAGEIYKHGYSAGLPDSPDEEGNPLISIHADEFNELIGDEFIPLINKAGGAGFQVTAYTQTWADIEARIRDRAKSLQITGNFNTLIMLRVKDPETAKLLTEQLSDVDVFVHMSVSGVTDSSSPDSGSHFTSRNEDRITAQTVPMLNPSELVQLPKGQAFALLSGGQLFKLRLPLPDARGDTKMPNELGQIVQEMRVRYTTNDTWHRSETPWWHQAAAAMQTSNPRMVSVDTKAEDPQEAHVSAASEVEPPQKVAQA